MDFTLKTDLTELMQKLKEIEGKINELASVEDEKLEWYKTDGQLIIKSGEYEVTRC